MNQPQYESWWQSNLGSSKYLHNGQWYDSPSTSSFEQWMGDSNSPDRVFARTLLLPYGSILDAGCGAAPEFNAVDPSKYTGLDITPKLVEYNLSRNINCVQGSLNNIPFSDNSFDVSISRHVTEHMPNIEQPITELIRVTKKQVLLYFFIKPVESNTHLISLDNQGTQWEIYHNTYSKNLIETILLNHNKVQSFNWVEGCGNTQTYLNILLK